MPLPATFTFSQSSLQDYTDCARRFELRYLQRLRWPAARAEPVLDHERNMQRGERFHHLLHQALVEVPMQKLGRTVTDDPVIAVWWEQVTNWLTKADLPSVRYPEMTLSVGTDIPKSSVGTPFMASADSDDDNQPQPPEYRLMAKYDLLAVEPGGRAIILDWKTTAPQSREVLERRWQTMVYRWVLTQAGHDLYGGQPIPPEQIEMVYWYAAGEPVRLRYDTAAFEHDELAIRTIIEQINQASTFPLTPDERKCRFCTYRSLCDRGRAAGDLDSAEFDGLDETGPDDFRIDLEQVAEVEF
jgi:hypothetical protein